MGKGANSLSTINITSCATATVMLPPAPSSMTDPVTEIAGLDTHL